jgi:hypothetical protein
MSDTLSNQSEHEGGVLLKELSDIKEILREISRELLRIERRVKAAFPGSAAVGRNGRSSARKKPKLDEQSARELLNTLKDRVSNGEQIETELRGYLVKPDLQMLARILGMTNAKLPPKDQLVSRISTRLRQSVSVTRGIYQAASSSKSSDEKVP